MARTLPTVIVQAMNAPQTDVAILALLTVSHPAITTKRLVNNTEDVTSGGNAFTAAPLSVVLPADVEGDEPYLRVSLSNVDREMVQTARTIAGSTLGLASATLQFVAADDPDTVLLEFNDFEVRNLTYTAEVVGFEMRLPSMAAEPYPAMTFTPNRFPALF